MKIQTDEEGNTRLHYAAACNKVNAVIAIVQQDNAVVHANNRAGHTALHLAATEGHYDTVTALVNAGANPCQLTPVRLSGVSRDYLVFNRKGLLRQIYLHVMYECATNSYDWVPEVTFAII
ncbi:hypothetical protein AC1031_008485 [Aphanomyces cochlioides]|nr:hypothetical protein AC1031_008485 [Aphanomyces cochlioides]